MHEGRFTLRDATPQDYEFLYNLHVATMKEYVEQTWGWDEARAANMFRERFHRGNFQFVVFDGRDIGAIKREKRETTINISNIEALPEFQNRGIGTAVISAIIAEGQRESLSVSLRVLKVNPARRLYERLGFSVTREDETHYYMATKVNCPSDSGNKAQMRAIVAMFGTGDLRNVAKAIDRNYIDHQGLEGVEIRGPEGFSRVVKAARGAVPDLQIKIEDLIAEDDRVVARLRWSGTTSNRKRIERETIDIIRFTNGRAQEHWGTALWVASGEHGTNPRDK